MNKQTTRREFMKRAALVTTALTAGPISLHRAEAAPAAKEALPWYRRTLRWGQTNITEIDRVRAGKQHAGRLHVADTQTDTNRVGLGYVGLSRTST